MNASSSTPLFSVVIPTYNRAARLVRALESVLAQSLTDYDVWVIDDGSQDDTPERLAPYLDRIHYIQQANSGAAKARNRGIQESHGKYVALLDSDDRWLPQKLAVIAAAIHACPDAALFYSGWEVVSEMGSCLWIDDSRAVTGSPYLALLKGDFIATSSVVIKRSSLERAGGFDAFLEPCEDWELWLRIARNYQIQWVPEVLVAYEHIQHNKATSNMARWLVAHDRVIEKTFALDPSLSEKIRQEVRANVAYVKGRVCLQAGDEPQALGFFKQATALHPLLLKAHLYSLVLSSPRFRRFLPIQLRRRMRLHEGIGERR